MRNPTFLLASSAAIIGATGLIIAVAGKHVALTPLIIAITGLITLGSTTRAIRSIRKPR